MKPPPPAASPSSAAPSTTFSRRRARPAGARNTAAVGLLLAGLLLAGAVRAQAFPEFTSEVFAGGGEGESGDPFYRIPTLARAPDGSLLAFAEGRQTPRDPGSGLPISMNGKRSTDGGRTWGAIRILARDPRFSYSDPRALVDERNGRVFLFYTQWPVGLGIRNVPAGLGPESSVLLCRMSPDSGRTWGAPVNLNPGLKDPGWRVLASIVGIGVQLVRQSGREGGHNGRLIFPASVRDARSACRNVSVCSDDGGLTWRVGRSLTPDDAAGESDLAELGDGRLLLSARNHAAGPDRRRHYLSRDGGENWSPGFPPGFAVPLVDCGLVYLPGQRPSEPGWTLISAPLGEPPGSGQGRANLGVWKSADEGATFPGKTQVVRGFSAYSQIIGLGPSSIGIIYEASPATRIVFMRGRPDSL